MFPPYEPDYEFEPDFIQEPEPILTDKTDNETHDVKEDEQPANNAELWEGFVRFIEQSADKSLVSLLRNSVLLNMTQESLTIGLQNCGLFTKEKRHLIESSAQEYFKQKIEIHYEDSMDGVDSSLRAKLEQDRLEKEKEKINQAGASNMVQQILSVFPQSKIKTIKIIEEKKDV